MADLAVYTTLYPGVERYICAWLRSIENQTDRDFDLWIGVNGMDISDAKELLSADTDIAPKWARGVVGATPADTRQCALAQIVDAYDVVVLVDSDDLLDESRIAAARETARLSDLGGCALRVVNAEGRDMGIVFGRDVGVAADEVLPRHNMFGLSNSVYRSVLLRRCLPIPSDVLLVDWFLATRAWLLGARLAFDGTTRMSYRQHGRNTARIVRPFERSQIVEDTEKVLTHFRLVLQVAADECLPERVTSARAVEADVKQFQRSVVGDARALDDYIERLNQLDVPLRWWSWVAHPSLSEMWL